MSNVTSICGVPARSRWNSIQLEFAQRPVVRREFALTLHDVDLHAWLVIRRGRIHFHLARRESWCYAESARSLPRPVFPRRSESGVTSSSRMSFTSPSQHRALNRGSYRHDLIPGSRPCAVSFRRRTCAPVLHLRLCASIRRPAPLLVCRSATSSRLPAPAFTGFIERSSKSFINCSSRVRVSFSCM